MRIGKIRENLSKVRHQAEDRLVVIQGLQDWVETLERKEKKLEEKKKELIDALDVARAEKSKFELDLVAEQGAHSTTISNYSARIKELEEGLESANSNMDRSEKSRGELQARFEAELQLAYADKRGVESDLEQANKDKDELSNTNKALQEQLKQQKDELEEARREERLTTENGFLYTLWQQHRGFDFSIFGESALERVADFEEYAKEQERQACVATEGEVPQEKAAEAEEAGSSALEDAGTVGAGSSAPEVVTSGGEVIPNEEAPIEGASAPAEAP